MEVSITKKWKVETVYVTSLTRGETPRLDIKKLIRTLTWTREHKEEKGYYR